MREALTRVSLDGLVNMRRMLAPMLHELARANLSGRSPAPTPVGTVRSLRIGISPAPCHRALQPGTRQPQPAPLLPT